MAHRIHGNDGLVLAGERAWHGLGLVVDTAPTPKEALRLAHLDWQVLESDSLTGIFNSDGSTPIRAVDPAHKMLVRSDDYSVLGVVGKTYRPVQNETLAELAWAFRQAGSDVGVEVESAGSIRGGKQVWMLLRSPSIDVTGFGDEVQPYLFIANSHNGLSALRVAPINIRVVCSNTYEAAMRATANGWSLRHTAYIGDRVESLKRDIERWYSKIDEGRKVSQAMARRKVNHDTVRDLWADVILALDGEIPEKPKNGWEERRRERSIGFFAHCAKVFDTEGAKYGYNMWTACNAATNAIQHYRARLSLRSAKRNPDVLAYEALDGATAAATNKAFDLALAAM